MWNQYTVELEFKTKFASGIPKNPDLLADYLGAKGHQGDDVPEEYQIDPEALAKTLAETSTDKWSVGFLGDDDGLYYEGARCIKAHLKDASNVLGTTTNKKGLITVRNLRSKLADRVYPVEEKVRLLRPDGEVIVKADGADQRPITVMTRQGPRTSIKQVDYVDPPMTMRFTLDVLGDGMITEKILHQCFEYGGVHGMGQDRGLGYGRYRLVKLEMIENTEE